VSRWELEVASRFEAAHRLYSWRGGSEPTHGHSWRVVARLATDRLDDEGMAFDFVAVREALDACARRLDHRDINTVAPFVEESPTTERIARWFFEELARALPAAPVFAVSVYEGPDCCATYRPHEEEEK
jgi:6-pyruvoyltetrahydropterin/6-carboxytetrahydropterin synthase